MTSKLMGKWLLEKPHLPDTHPDLLPGSTQETLPITNPKISKSPVYGPHSVAEIVEDLGALQITHPTTSTSPQMKPPKHDNVSSNVQIMTDMAEKIVSLFQYHTSRRMADPTSVPYGISIPSQRRSIRYWGDILMGKDSRRSLTETSTKGFNSKQIEIKWIKVYVAQTVRYAKVLTSRAKVAVQVCGCSPSICCILLSFELARSANVNHMCDLVFEVSTIQRFIRTQVKGTWGFASGFRFLSHSAAFSVRRSDLNVMWMLWTPSLKPLTRQSSDFRRLPPVHLSLFSRKITMIGHGRIAKIWLVLLPRLDKRNRICENQSLWAPRETPMDLIYPSPKSWVGDLSKSVICHSSFSKIWPWFLFWVVFFWVIQLDKPAGSRASIVTDATADTTTTGSIIHIDESQLAEHMSDTSSNHEEIQDPVTQQHRFLTPVRLYNFPALSTGEGGSQFKKIKGGKSIESVGGVKVDADREILLRIVLGSTGKNHASLLPDATLLGYLCEPLNP